MNLAGIHDNSNLPLFRPLVFHRSTSSYTLRDGKMSYSSCREILRDSLKQLGPNPDDYGIHSLRSGGITSVVRKSCNSVSERLLKLHGRWKTDTAKDMYVEEGLDNRLLQVTPPSRLPLHRFSPAQEKYISEETQRLLERDVIEPSTSPWSAQVVLHVASKKDGSYRYCIDFRRLNCGTVKEHYPVPRVEDVIDTLAGANFFSTLDLISAYHAFEIHPNDREKTATYTKQGHWQ